MGKASLLLKHYYLDDDVGNAGSSVAFNILGRITKKFIEKEFRKN